MTTLPRVLVTGASGKTGMATVFALIEHHSDAVQVRALVRQDDHRAHALREAGAEVVFGDLGDIRDVRRAMKDVQRAHFLAAVTNSSLDHAVNFAVAASEQDLEHVTALGQWLSSDSHPSVLTRRTWLIDQLLTWVPEIDHTVINVGFLADNFMSMLGTAAQMGMLPLPLGNGSTAPISNEDIGRVVAAVLANPTPYAGRTLRPTGPEILTPEDMAAVFGEVLGREVEYSEGSEKMLLKSFSALGRSPFELAQVVHYMREFRRGAFLSGGTTDVVQDVTGRPAEDFATITRRYAASDPMALRSFPNRLRAMAQMAKILLTPVPDMDEWLRDAGVPVIDGEDCVDHEEWNRTHDVPNAFGVGRTLSKVASLTS